MDDLANAVAKPLRSAPFAIKMAVIAVLFLIPIALLIVVLFLQLNADRTFYRSEKIGVAYTKSLRPLFEDLETYRLTSPAKTPEVASRIEADFAAADAFDGAAGRPLALTDALRALEAKWRKPAPAADLLNDLIALQSTVSDSSKITLDPILDGYYVGDTMVNKAPSLIDGIAQSAVIGAAALASGKLSTDDRISVAELSGQITAARDGIEHNIPIATGAAPYLTIAGTSQTAEKDAVTAFASWLDKALLKVAQPRGRRAELLMRRSESMKASFVLYDRSIAAMDDVLDHRLRALAVRTSVIFGTVLAVILIAGVIMFAIARSMSKALADVTEAITSIVTQDIALLTKSLKRLAAGDLTGRLTSARAPLRAAGSDEVGVLVSTYNSLALALTDMAAEFTMATSELHGLVACVAATSKSLVAVSGQSSAAAQQSTSAVAEIAAAVDLVAGGALAQSEQIADTATAIEELSRTAEQIEQVALEQANSIAASMLALAGLDDEIGAVAQEGNVLRTSAKEASAEAVIGTSAVRDTVATMTSLRAGSVSAATAMNALEERSAQVGEIVETIEDIADQTNLLALNAAIEAARAGDAGRGFAVVADEVRKLADRSRTATKDISQILGAMRRETHVAAETMRASVESMNSSIEISERATRSLDAVASAIGTTTNVAETLAVRSQQMRTASVHVTDNMSSTSAAVEENATAASEMRSTTDHVTNVIVPIAATASANAQTAQSAAAATQQLAEGIGDIESTSRMLRDKASELESLLERFTIDGAIQARKHLRFRVAFDVSYSIAGRPAAKGHTRDIGGGGMCFECAENIPPNCALTVRFSLPNVGFVEAQAQVVSSSFDSARSVHVQHVSFSAFPQSLIDAISSYIHEARQGVLLAAR